MQDNEAKQQKKNDVQLQSEAVYSYEQPLTNEYKKETSYIWMLLGLLGVSLFVGFVISLLLFKIIDTYNYNKAVAIYGLKIQLTPSGSGVPEYNSSVMLKEILFAWLIGNLPGIVTGKVIMQEKKYISHGFVRIYSIISIFLVAPLVTITSVGLIIFR